MGMRHLQALHNNEIQIAGICDIKREALDHAGSEFPVPDVFRFSCAEDLLRTVAPDCVIISTTADSHCELTCLAAESGVKYILCEKPMGRSISECMRMIETIERCRVKLAINHPMRYMESYTEPKRIVQTESFGELRSMTVVGGNFGLAMNGMHFFEAFRFLTGKEIVEVAAWPIDSEVPNPRGPQFEDKAGSVRVSTEDCARLYVDCGPRQGHRVIVTYAGEYGQLVVDHLTGTMFLTVREEEHRDLPTTRYAMPSVDRLSRVTKPDVTQATTALIKAFVSGEHYPTGYDGLAAVRTLVGAYLSHESGHLPVNLTNTSLPIDRSFNWA